MKHLYRLQTILVVIFLSMIPSWSFGQFADPIIVNVKNTGSSFSDQFSASTGYAFGILQDVSSQLGFAGIVPGASPNTLKVTFEPVQGAIGTTDLIVTYYTLSAPMHPVTRWYRFNIDNELVITGQDNYLIDMGAANVPLSVLDNDSITNGQLFISKVSVSNAAVSTVDSTGETILFTPGVDFEGDTWLQYIACDSFGNCGEGNVHVLVRDPNAQDSIVYTKFLLNTRELEILSPFDSFEATIEPSHGTLTSFGNIGWVYTPDEGFTGKDTFEIGLLNLVYRNYQVTVYEKNTNIHARDDKFYVRPALSVTFNVLNNDLLDYDINSYTNPSKGVLVSLGDGAYTYTPNLGFRGVDKFTYTTCFQDTVYCETATVLLHVTDLEPDNQFSYQLQTSKDLPLVIDYPVDYTDFSYIITDDPDHGVLTFYNGLQQINLPCDTFEGFNTLVYKPTPGYTGADYFEYWYCIEPTNLCYKVKVDMDVVNHPEAENCPCIVGCVWPGDTDKNGRVDMADLLTLGNKLGDSGPDRNYSDPETWFGQHSLPWESGDTQLRFIDADGDGTITSADVDQIDEYYYQTHDIVVRDVQQKLPYQFTIIPVQYSLDSGDVVILDIALGNATYPVIDIKGVKFSINIPAYMMDSASVEVDFHQNSWLAEAAPNISLGKVPWDGRIDAGFARAQGIGATGYGVIATVVFIIEEDLEGFKTNDGKFEVPISLEGGTVMDGEGTMYDLDGSEIVLKGEPASNPNLYDLIVFPNPSNGLVNVHLNGKTAIESISIIDLQGRAIHSFDGIDKKQFQFDAGSLSSGLYFLRVKHTGGTLTKTLSVIK